MKNDLSVCGTTHELQYVERTMKKIKIVRVNPIAKAMLTDRKSPQVVPPKKGKKKPHKRVKISVRSDIYDTEI